MPPSFSSNHVTVNGSRWGKKKGRKN